MVTTVRPNASETPTRPMPTSGNFAASTALPQPPNTSQNVPNNSATERLRMGMRLSPCNCSWRAPHLTYVASAGSTCLRHARYTGMRTIRTCLPIVVLGWLAACGGGDDGGTPPAIPVPDPFADVDRAASAAFAAQGISGMG